MTKLDAGLMTSLPASDPGSATVWGSKRINPLPQSCLCLTWSGYLFKRRRRRRHNILPKVIKKRLISPTFVKLILYYKLHNLLLSYDMLSHYCHNILLNTLAAKEKIAKPPVTLHS